MDDIEQSTVSTALLDCSCRYVQLEVGMGARSAGHCRCFGDAIFAEIRDSSRSTVRCRNAALLCHGDRVTSSAPPGRLAARATARTGQGGLRRRSSGRAIEAAWQRTSPHGRAMAETDDAWASAVEAIGRVPPARVELCFATTRSVLRKGSSGNAGGMLAASEADAAVAMIPCLRAAVGRAVGANPRGVSDWPFSLAVHDEQEARAAREAGADLVFISPVFPTGSHPGAAALGAERAGRLAEMAGCPAVALGGMSFGKFWEIGPAFHGWAGIDAWLE